jgi:hypothetical protein
MTVIENITSWPASLSPDERMALEIEWTVEWIEKRRIDPYWAARERAISVLTNATHWFQRGRKRRTCDGGDAP